VFYDINLEVDQILPHIKDASEIKVSTSSNSISQTGENTIKKSLGGTSLNNAPLWASHSTKKHPV